MVVMMGTDNRVTIRKEGEQYTMIVGEVTTAVYATSTARRGVPQKTGLDKLREDFSFYRKTGGKPEVLAKRPFYENLSADEVEVLEKARTGPLSSLERP